MGAFFDFLTGGKITAAAIDLGKSENLPARTSGPKFDAEFSPYQLMAFGSGGDPVTVSPKVSRTCAMQVPAVKRARDLICSVIGGLPIELFNVDNVQSPSSLFDQPEPDVPRSVTVTRTVDDLLFYGIAWWHITAFDSRGYPFRVRRLDPRSVTVNQVGQVTLTQAGHTGYASVWIPDAELIRFDSPNDPLLSAGARAIRTALTLDQSANTYAAGLPPLDYFSPTEGIDPVDDEDVQALLDGWAAARTTRATAYVPAALHYNSVQGFNPEQIQLMQAREFAISEIARASGVHPSLLGVSTGKPETYKNAQDERKQFIDFTLSPLVNAIEDRLSMGDVTPRGYKARFDFTDFMRASDLERMAVYTQGLANGAYTHDEVRASEDKPATPEPKPAPAPALPAATPDPSAQEAAA